MSPDDTAHKIDYKMKYPITFGDHKAATDAKLAERRRQAWAAAKLAAKVLKQSFAATRVAAFGSLTDPEQFSLWSDIDIAAWGIPPNRYYAAMAAVMDLGHDIEIDLVDIELCPPALRETIEREGVEL